MGRLINALRRLGSKLTGKETIDSSSIVEILNDIADDYTGGGSGATYTAGNGIGITEENVINADVKVIETSNITGLTTEQCESLNVGDVVIKLTSNQKHTYRVSYKEAGVGMCLTYVDASTSETISYDYVDSAWVYNSTDITPLKNVVANPTLAGTEDTLTGLQIGETKYSVPQGGGSTNLKSDAEFYYAISGKTFNYSKFLQLLTSKGININEDISSTELRISLNIGSSGAGLAVEAYNTDTPIVYAIRSYIGNNTFEATDTNNSSTLANMIWNSQLGPYNFLESDYAYTGISKPNITDNSDTFISDITIDEVIALFDDAN